MESPRIKVEINDAIALVSLNRPDKLNALDMPMFRAIDKLIKTLKRDRTIRVVIVTGVGEDFCSGLDIKSVLKSPLNGLKLLFKWLPGSSNLAQRVSTGWRSIPVPVIFAIHGRCWGGGLQIALGGDFRIATEDSSWAIMEGRWGLIPDMGGTLAFRQLCRIDEVMELAMTARTFSGAEAKNFGLVTHISEKPLDAAMALANKLIQSSPDAVAASKRLFYKSWWSSSRKALFKESFYQIRILLGKNQSIAVERSAKKCDKPFVQRRF